MQHHPWHPTFHHHPQLNSYIYHPYLHSKSHLEHTLQCNINPPTNGCHHLLDLIVTMPPMVTVALTQHRLGKDMDVITEPTTTRMEDVVEPPALECDLLINFTPTPFKRFNNWYYCFSCEYDNDHEGDYCPWNICKPNHNSSVTKTNAHLFLCASLHEAHKTVLPGKLGHPIQHTWLIRAAGHK